jgi:hypothetical protein
MALRSWRSVTILLVLASACPPPRVSNALIAALHRHDPAEAGKSVQSRARNRIGSTIQVDACRTIAGLESGRSRPSRTEIRPLERPSPDPPLSRSIAHRATLRLRC